MKALARGYRWWQNIDSDIEKLVKNCLQCQTYKNEPKKIQLHEWEKTDTPFQRVHVDFAGPFMGKLFFILVDAHTKWPEVHIVENLLSETTIKKCKEIFAQFGLPKIFVSDNARTFTSGEFKKFLEINGIIQKFSAPYHPATNGQAERYVQTIKNALLKMSNNGKVETNLQTILCKYRNMPHAVTGVAPAELMFGRKLRIRLNLLKSSIKNCKPENHFGYDTFTVQKNFFQGERVTARNYHSKEKWLPGYVKERVGKIHYLIKMDNGQIWRRHVDQINKVGKNLAEKCYYYYVDP